MPLQNCFMKAGFVISADKRNPLRCSSSMRLLCCWHKLWMITRLIPRASLWVRQMRWLSDSISDQCRTRCWNLYICIVNTFFCSGRVKSIEGGSAIGGRNDMIVMRLCRPQWTTCKFHNFPEIWRDSWDISSKGLYLWAFLLASIGRTSWDHWKLFLWSGFLGSKWWPLWFCVVLSKLVLGLGWGCGPIPNMKYIKIETVDMFNVGPQAPQKFFCSKRHGANSDVVWRDDFPTKRGAPWGRGFCLFILHCFHRLRRASASGLRTGGGVSHFLGRVS